LPRNIALNHHFLTLEIATPGGHVGYLNHKHQWWLDQRFLTFFTLNEPNSNVLGNG
jgi:predicted alpha/beta-fold hydrolase